MVYAYGKVCGNLKHRQFHVSQHRLNRRPDNCLVRLVCGDLLKFLIIVVSECLDAVSFYFNKCYYCLLGKQSENTPQSVDSPQSTSVSEPTKHEDEVF